MCNLSWTRCRDGKLDKVVTRVLALDMAVRSISYERPHMNTYTGPLKCCVAQMRWRQG